MTSTASAKSFPKKTADANLKEKIDKIFKSHGIPQAEVGASIGWSNGEIIYELNQSKMMLPASISKIATASSVLKHIPPGSKLKTQLLSKANVKAGVLQGDLYLKGGGDPSFVSESMWYLVNVLTRSNISKIQGNIIVDDSLFDSVRFDESRQKERVDRAYDAPTSAMSFNWNSVNVFVRATSPGENAEVFIDPENDYIKLRGAVKTTSSDTAIAVDRDEDKKGVGDVIVVSGKIAKNAKEQVVYKNITQPDLWAGHNLKSFLKQRNISVEGEVKKGETPSSARVLAEAESKPIEFIVADMNKFSNNYIAEMLAKNLAATQQTPGTINKAMEIIKQDLVKLGLKPGEDFDLKNPSGLTRDNRLTAHAMWKILADIKNYFPAFSEFISSLPIAGVDGTLKNRMKNTPGERWVRAKTGYLNNVVALAGFIGQKDGDIIPFVLMYNGSVDEAKVRQAFDQVATAVVEN